jgi:hypothetical protein
MNTCKATLRVLFAHRVYLMIYLVFIGILMMSISWAMLTSASGSMSAVFESTKTRVAIIDRDSDRGDIATRLPARFQRTGGPRRHQRNAATGRRLELGGPDRHHSRRIR